MDFNFPLVDLGDICTIKGGKRLPKGHTLLEAKTNHPYIRARDIHGGVINFTEPVYIANKTYEKISRYIVSFNDVIITIVGANIGDIAFVTEEFNNANLTENAVKLTATRNIIPKFLKYALVPPYMKGYFQTIASGAAQGKLGLYKIKKVQIPLPPLPTQQKIAHILSAYDDLIENNLKRIKLLEEMAQQTYEEWFVRMKFPKHETTPIDDETGLPEGWEKKNLIEVCNLIMGQSPKSEFYNTQQQGLPFHQGVKDYGFRFPANTSWSTEGKRIAIKGDVLFSVRAPVGRLNMAIEKIILGRGLSAIRHKAGFQSFLFYQLQKIFFEEDMMGGGAIFSSVTKNDMNRVELLCPSETLLKKFNNLASAIDKNIENLHKQNQLLKEARDILLPRLMTGIIDVDTLEIPTIPESTQTKLTNSKKAVLNEL